MLYLHWNRFAKVKAKVLRNRVVSNHYPIVTSLEDFSQKVRASLIPHRPSTQLFDLPSVQTAISTPLLKNGPWPSRKPKPSSHKLGRSSLSLDKREETPSMDSFKTSSSKSTRTLLTFKQKPSPSKKVSKQEEIIGCNHLKLFFRHSWWAGRIDRQSKETYQLLKETSYGGGPPGPSESFKKHLLLFIGPNFEVVHQHFAITIGALISC